jgi:hypothetical protein
MGCSVNANALNPLGGGLAGETINRAKNVVSYVQFTADSYARAGSSATDALVLILESVVDALDAAVVQTASAKGGAS